MYGWDASWSAIEPLPAQLRSSGLQEHNTHRITEQLSHLALLLARAGDSQLLRQVGFRYPSIYVATTPHEFSRQNSTFCEPPFGDDVSYLFGKYRSSMELRFQFSRRDGQVFCVTELEGSIQCLEFHLDPLIVTAQLVLSLRMIPNSLRASVVVRK